MSVFGNMDTDKIKGDPWSIADGYYRVSVTKCYESSTDGKDYVNFRFTVDMPESDFHGKSASNRYEIFPDVDDVEKDLTPDQKTSVERLVRFLRRGLGYDNQRLADWGKNVESAIGDETVIKIRNNKGTGQYEGQTFMNIVDAMTVEEYEKKHDQLSEVAQF